MKRKITFNRITPDSVWINAQQDFSFVVNNIPTTNKYRKRGWFGPTIAGICLVLFLALTIT
jgi:hypothetical protein